MAAIPDPKFEALLRLGSKDLGLPLSEEGIQRLVVHHDLLLRWALKTNLTTIRDPEGMAERLYLESAILLPHLGAGASIHDVGTGAGFPGLVLKALDPRLVVTLTEARRKKVSFLKQAAREMGLEEGLTICWERLGWSGAGASEHHWGEVVSRAAFPPNDWIAMGYPLVARGGRLWLLATSPQPDDPATAALSNLSLPLDLFPEDVLHYRLPFSGVERQLQTFRRRAGGAEESG